MSLSSLDILFEDEHIIVVNKPAGLLVHPSWLTPRGTENVAAMLKDYFEGATVYTVHRLDRATSGVLICAKNKAAAQRLSQDFAAHNLEKKYLCVVRGFAPEQGVIDHPLKYQDDKIAEPTANPDKEAQEAVTHFKRLGVVELPIAVGKWQQARYSLMLATPSTGRKHQIRRHFKHLLCPLVGDTNYGEGRHNRLFREHYDIHRLLLHAVSLQFYHPVTLEKMTIRAPLGDQLMTLFETFSWPVQQEY